LNGVREHVHLACLQADLKVHLYVRYIHARRTWRSASTSATFALGGPEGPPLRPLRSRQADLKVRLYVRYVRARRTW